MKIIQTQLRDMPSSLLAELGSYRYNVFARGEGWSIPSRLTTPGQEYDRFDRSDVTWLIAWSAKHGICGCARLMKWPETQHSPGVAMPVDRHTIWEMSRFSARLDIDSELPLKILWHALQIAAEAGIQYVASAATPMMEKMFEHHQIVFEPLMPGLIHSEDNLFAVKLAVKQPVLADKYQGSRHYSPEEVLPSLAISVSWDGR
ncbi:acyl-homoserine-lactone synthase [Winslowiella iniecta]|uniref:Acyl-homoserine-lactone synthase n=1 Tax=Winslowiella iniecta TaxID=1560201 RepID=A0A0L7T514_9GAMM|nr:acyl-homoserine-lactone synthase [Winslowiella iniecta]KOC88973.1 autoinducer synthase [Winslowiella iniecta]KOC90433.1 autoinducer synthase [Winslowiella iniecta]